MKIEYVWLLLLMTMLGAVAGLFLKRASGSKNLLGIVKNPNLYLGGCFYLIAALLNVYVLRYLEYSIVLPLTSITYIWTMLVSYIVLKERITRKKVIGVSLIILGAVVLVL